MACEKEDLTTLSSKELTGYLAVHEFGVREFQRSSHTILGNISFDTPPTSDENRIALIREELRKREGVQQPRYLFSDKENTTQKSRGISRVKQLYLWVKSQLSSLQRNR